MDGWTDGCMGVIYPKKAENKMSRIIRAERHLSPNIGTGKNKKNKNKKWHSYIPFPSHLVLLSFSYLYPPFSAVFTLNLPCILPCILLPLPPPFRFSSCVTGRDETKRSFSFSFLFSWASKNVHISGVGDVV